MSQSLFSVLNYYELNHNILDFEIDAFNKWRIKHKSTTPSIQNMMLNARQPPIVVNNSPENQHDFRGLKTVQRETSYNDVLKDHKGNENNVIIFNNIVANFDKNTNVKVNKRIRSRWAIFQNFQDATSEELLNYIDPALAERNYDTAIVHIEINDIINYDD